MRRGDPTCLIASYFSSTSDERFRPDVSDEIRCAFVDRAARPPAVRPPARRKVASSCTRLVCISTNGGRHRSTLRIKLGDGRAPVAAATVATVAAAVATAAAAAAAVVADATVLAHPTCYLDAPLEINSIIYPDRSARCAVTTTGAKYRTVAPDAPSRLLVLNIGP